MPRETIAIASNLESLAILDNRGQVDATLDPELDDERARELHRAMLRARRFDERRLSLQRRGEIGTFAPVNGQEAAQVGTMACVETDDWFVPAFRETAAALYRGADMAPLLLYDGGYNEGAAQEPGQRDLPIAIPVASQLPHAAGIGYALQQRGEAQAVITFFGDGATSEGDFHEALNFAGVYQLPVVFLCQNNQWAISTPRSRQSASQTLAQKAIGYGLPGLVVDGNDLLGCYVAARDALARARDGGGAPLIEAQTYRQEVHTTADDPGKYRDEAELEEWLEYDPIDRVQRYLRQRDALDAAALESLEDEIEAEIDAAWETAQSRMEALAHRPGVMFEHVTGGVRADLEAQREALERRVAPARAGGGKDG